MMRERNCSWKSNFTASQRQLRVCPPSLLSKAFDWLFNLPSMTKPFITLVSIQLSIEIAPKKPARRENYRANKAVHVVDFSRNFCSRFLPFVFVPSYFIDIENNFEMSNFTRIWNFWIWMSLRHLRTLKL